MFLKYFQGRNKWDYTKNQVTDYQDLDSYAQPDFTIDRARTISLILDATAGRYGTTSTNTTSMLNSVKDLIYNGYGVLLLTNVGFPNVRDSTGIAYPDRIFYQTYNIIGYDDTKAQEDQTLYVLHCPFGNWISGGHPTWGELPPGCFVVTEDRLRCMIDYYPGADFYGCRRLPCPNGPPDYCNNFTSAEMTELNGCGGGYENQCDPYYCTKVQRAHGLLFAVSTNNGFPRQQLDYEQFYPITLLKDIIAESDRRSG